MVFSRIAVTNSHRDDARRATSHQQAIVLANMTPEFRKTKLNEAYKFGMALGRKFEIEDVNAHLLVAAEIFAYQYEGDFSYMVDMKAALARFGHLTDAQAKGTLNCLMAEARRRLAGRQQAASDDRAMAQAEALADRAGTARDNARPTVEDHTTVAVAAASVAQAPVRDGYFTVAFGDGTHRTFRLTELREEELARYAMPRGAQHISLLVGPENTTAYARIGIVVNRQIVRRWRVVRTVQGQNATEAQLSRMEEGMRVLLSADGEAQTEYGMAFAIASNRCSRCGHVLTVPASVHRGLGPDCSTRI